MRLLIKYFLRGLLVVLPAAVTIWVLYSVFVFVDDLFPRPEDDGWTWTIPLIDYKITAETLAFRGAGFLIVIAGIILAGFLTSNLLTRQMLFLAEQLFTRVPVVKLLYNAVKDMIEAFVSEEKKFDKPVRLHLADNVDVIGFVTQESLDEFGWDDLVGVYVPQSYNFAANLILVPRERVTPIDKPAGDVMAFVVSGGVAKSVEREANGDE